MKEGIPYFPLDCTFKDDMKLLEAEFGLTGVAIIVKLYQRIYGELGYYCDWNDEVALLFGRNACMLGSGDNVVSEVIKCALRRGIFNKSMYDKFNILTSVEIQKNYFEAVKRRKFVEVKKEYLLFSAPKNQENADISQENVCKSGENVDRNKQRRVEESREEESNNFCAEQESSAPKKAAILMPLNDNTEYPITDGDISEWKELYPAVDILQELRKMKGWLKSNPARRKTKRGIKRFINGWLAKEQDKGYKVVGLPQKQNSVKQSTADEIMRRAAEMGMEV